MNNTKSIMVVAGEASGDLHGAHLVRAMQEEQPDIHFCGMGGRELAATGMEMLFDAAKVAVVGIVEVVSHLADILKARRILVNRLKENPPDLLILIDYPDFNLLLGKKAKQLGIPIFYYISPQVWAWRSGRATKIASIVDKIVVILPFEKQFYKTFGIDVDFVGHPLMDSVKSGVTRSQYLKKYSISPEQKVVGLLPGSRMKEISSLMPVFLAAAVQLDTLSNHQLVFLLPKASTISQEMLNENGLAEYKDKIDVRVISDNRYDMMAACDAAIVASGTVTLELAILEIPLVATYRTSPLTYRLGKLLVRLKYMTLVNLIAGHEVVPELLQEEVTPDNIVKKVSPFLFDDKENMRMRDALKDVHDLLGEPGATKRTARLALDLFV